AYSSPYFKLILAFVYHKETSHISYKVVIQSTVAYNSPYFKLILAFVYHKETSHISYKDVPQEWEEHNNRSIPTPATPGAGLELSTIKNGDACRVAKLIVGGNKVMVSIKMCRRGAARRYPHDVHAALSCNYTHLTFMSSSDVLTFTLVLSSAVILAFTKVFLDAVASSHNERPLYLHQYVNVGGIFTRRAVKWPGDVYTANSNPSVTSPTDHSSRVQYTTTVQQSTASCHAPVRDDKQVRRAQAAAQLCRLYRLNRTNTIIRVCVRVLSDSNTLCTIVSLRRGPTCLRPERLALSRLSALRTSVSTISPSSIALLSTTNQCRNRILL
ncbi:hypothetical protein J6590_026972, partial [Homalodisca vitripennis]